jgi:hypothetical protein
MNQDLSTHTDRRPAVRGHDGHGRHSGHGLVMIACCIPMLIIAVALVAAGVVSPGFLLTAIACTVMMAAMMRIMPGHGGGPSDR